MTDKKSLDFDFLDESPKKADEKTVSHAVAKPVLETGKVNIFQYFKECFTNFPKFAEENLDAQTPKYLAVAVWVMGMGNVAGRLTSDNSSSWGETWAIVIFGGILAGALAYFFGGWFYNVRVKWSKGQANEDTSKNLFTFASLPISIVAVGSLIFNQMAYGDDYFSSYYSDASTVDMIAALLTIVAIGYSIYISYRAVRKIMHVQKGRAILWFVVAPVVFYILVMISGALNS